MNEIKILNEVKIEGYVSFKEVKASALSGNLVVSFNVSQYKIVKGTKQYMNFRVVCFSELARFVETQVNNKESVIVVGRLDQQIHKETKQVQIIASMIQTKNYNSNDFIVEEKC